MPDAQRKATALHYEGTGAPKVVASGRGLVADRILEVARGEVRSTEGGWSYWRERTPVTSQRRL